MDGRGVTDDYIAHNVIIYYRRLNRDVPRPQPSRLLFNAFSPPYSPRDLAKDRKFINTPLVNVFVQNCIFLTCTIER